MSKRTYPSGLRLDARANFLGQSELKLLGDRIVSNPGGLGVSEITKTAKDNIGFTFVAGYEKDLNKRLSLLTGVSYVYHKTKEFNLNTLDIIKHPLRVLGVEKYVNLITCDEQYAHGIYEDNSIQFLWIDGDHGKNIVYNDLVNFWPKIKNGGTIGGDDMVYNEVSDDVKKFSKEYNVKVEYENTNGLNHFIITKE